MTVRTPFGQVLRDQDGMRLEFRRSYDAPVEEVWSALTEPGRVAWWLGRWTGDPSTGSVELVLTAEQDPPTEVVHILSCVPPRRLVVEMPSPDGAWRLEVTLSQDGGTTDLLFVQRLAEPYDASSIGPGWHYYLDRFEAALRGADGPEDFDAYFPALRDRYALPGSPTTG